MLDLGFVRVNLPSLFEKLLARGADKEALDIFLQLEVHRRQAITAAEKTKARLNQLSQQVGDLKKTGQDPSSLMDEIRGLKAEFGKQNELASEADARMRESLARFPNLTREEVPDGKSEAENLVVKTWGTIPAFDFSPIPHWEIGKNLGILDLERAAKISGARFAVYMGAGARLERALISFMLDTHTQKHGYTEVLPPFMVNSDSLFGTGQLPKFANDLFRCADADVELLDEIRSKVEETRKDSIREPGAITDTLYKEALRELEHAKAKEPAIFNDHWLIPTAEVPVTNLYRDEILDDAKLPICFTAYTP